MNGLKIYGENFVNEYCDITVTSGDATKAYIYDQKRDTKWSSSGTDEYTVETVTIIFKNWQGEEVTRNFDRVVLLNHNLRVVTAQYFNGSTWETISEMSQTLDTTDTIIEIGTAISGSRFRINCLNTQGVISDEKTIGELKVCLSILEDAEWKSSFPRRDDKRGDSYRLSDGPLVSWKEWTKVEGSLSLENVKLADLQSVMPYMKTAAYLTMVFYSDFDLTETFEFVVRNAPVAKLDRKVQLFSVTMELEER